MAAWKKRSEAKDDIMTLRKPSALFWREDNGNKPRTETTRKKNPSGDTINKPVKVQTSTKDSKENRAPTMDKQHQRHPSLKDLCPEDKQRVKLLIEQLARTSSEKEAIEDKVREERRQFTLLLDKLKKQHHKVVKEKKEVEMELHASQLQLQAIHTYPPSSANNMPQLLTHLHMGPAVVATTTTNPLQTAAVSTGPSTSVHALLSRSLTVGSQPSVMRTPLSTLSATGVRNSTAALPQYDTESMSSSVTGLPTIQASYPANFAASSRNPNHASSDHTQRESSSTSTACPPQNLMESLSTTSISLGVPLSSTHMQFYSQQECHDGKRPPHVKPDPPLSDDATAIQNGGNCYSREEPSIEHEHHRTLTGLEEQHYQVSVPLIGEQEASADQATTIARTEPATPPASVRQHWLSLPSATPEQHSSPCDKMKRDRSLFFKQDGSVGGSSREIGTQTLCVESVATQTDREEHDNPPTSPTIRERSSVLSSSPTLTKKSVDSTAMSVGDLHTTAPSNTDTSQAKFKLNLRYSEEHQNQDDSPHLDRSTCNSEDVLLQELLMASFLLNGQETLAGGQTDSQGYSSTSKEAELLRLEPMSPFKLAASLNSHKDSSPSPQPSFSLILQQHGHSHKDPNPPFSCHRPSLQSSVTRLSTTTAANPENTPPKYTNYPYYYRDWDRDTTRQGWSLDDSQLIEELFFI